MTWHWWKISLSCFVADIFPHPTALAISSRSQAEGGKNKSRTQQRLVSGNITVTRLISSITHHLPPEQTWLTAAGRRPALPRRADFLQFVSGHLQQHGAAQRRQTPHRAERRAHHILARFNGYSSTPRIVSWSHGGTLEEFFKKQRKLYPIVRFWPFPNNINNVFHGSTWLRRCYSFKPQTYILLKRLYSSQALTSTGLDLIG